MPLHRPDRERSHFDAQNLLENGSARPYGLDTGWLGRALTVAGLPGIALSTTVPVIMRGGTDVSNWSPGTSAQPGAETQARVRALYAETPTLATAFEAAVSANGTIGEGSGAGFSGLASAAARFLTVPNGSTAAFLELGGGIRTPGS